MQSYPTCALSGVFVTEYGSPQLAKQREGQNSNSGVGKRILGSSFFDVYIDAFGVCPGRTST